MSDFNEVPFWVWALSAPVGFFGVKFIWPLMKQSLDTQIQNGRSESGQIKQLTEERDKQQARAEKAEKRVEELIIKVADFEADMKIMRFKLEQMTEMYNQAFSKLNQLKEQYDVNTL